MVDRATAMRGADSLGVAIAAVLEDTATVAVHSASDLAGYRAKAKRLLAAGDDIAVLAQAMAVLARRGRGA